MKSKSTGETAMEFFPFVLAVLSGCGGIISYAFTTFETKELSKERYSTLEARLERIETKLDRALFSK